MSGTLHVRGINWEISSFAGKPAYTHQNIRIAFDIRSGVWYAKDQNGSIIIARVLPSDCIKDMTVHILDAYASRIVPSWEAYDEESKEEEKEEGRRDTIPDAIYCSYSC